LLLLLLVDCMMTADAINSWRKPSLLALEISFCYKVNYVDTLWKSGLINNNAKLLLFMKSPSSIKEIQTRVHWTIISK
jgi:hypothetical protein